MTKFNVGDVVTCDMIGYAVYQKEVTVSEVGTYNDGVQWFKTKDSKYPDHDYRSDEFKLVRAGISVEQAQEILEQHGYTVVAPKKPMSGEAVVYRGSVGVAVVSKSYYDEWSAGSRRMFPPIAIVKWTEGEGL